MANLIAWLAIGVLTEAEFVSSRFDCDGGNMKGIFLRFYMLEKHHHRHRPVYEWLLQEARMLGIHGGTAFRAVAGFGHHGKLHFDHFFELQGDLPVQLDFVVTEQEADKLMSVVSKEQVRLFYLRIPAEFGVLNPDQSDPAEAA